MAREVVVGQREYPQTGEGSGEGDGGVKMVVREVEGVEEETVGEGEGEGVATAVERGTGQPEGGEGGAVAKTERGQVSGEVVEREVQVVETREEEQAGRDGAREEVVGEVQAAKARARGHHRLAAEHVVR